MKNWKNWIKCAGVRAIRTVAQAALGVLSGQTLFTEVDWTVVASSAALAGVYSLLTSVAGLPELREDGEAA